MKKAITISGKTYMMQSSAYTQFKYKNDTGRNLLQDINKLSKMKPDNKDDIMNDLNDFLSKVLQLTYVMIEEADPKQVASFETFLKEPLSILKENFIQIVSVQTGNLFENKPSVDVSVLNNKTQLTVVNNEKMYKLLSIVTHRAKQKENLEKEKQNETA